MTDENTAGTPASEGDFTGTATGADGANNTALEGETFPSGDPETVGDGNRGPLGESFDS